MIADSEERAAIDPLAPGYGASQRIRRSTTVPVGGGSFQGERLSAV